MNQQRRMQIYEHFRTYFGTIRDFLGQEREYEPLVPQLFKFTYLFLVYECRDGYAVAAYPSGFADNYIYIGTDQTVAEVIKSLPNLIAGTSQHLVPNISNWGGSGALEIIIDHVETPGGPLPTTGWKFLSIATPDYDWPVAEAQAKAREAIQIFKARASVYQPDESPLIKSYDAILQRREITVRLQDILARYRAIITEPHFRERVIHRFLRDHPIMLFPTKKRMPYEYPLKEGHQLRYKIDFVVELPSGRYILVELENPSHNLFTAAGEFSAAVNHAESQVRDWMLWLRHHLAGVERELPGMVAPEGLVVIGRGKDINGTQREKIRIRNEKHEIKILDYDDLAEEAENHIRHLLEA